MLLLISCGGREVVVHDSERIEVGSDELRVAIADDAEERRQGLRGVEDLGDVEGMLFVFEQPTSTTFVMLDTLIPLDMWWFDAEGVLIGGTEMEPCPGEPCTRYRSPGPISWALETPAGEFGFDVGSVLVLP